MRRGCHRFWPWLLVALGGFVPLAPLPGAQAYYIDADGGDDANSGAAPGQAWASLARAGAAAYAPGDQILLQRGDAFTGKLLLSGVGGSPGHPIVVASYGEGPAPVIDCSGYLAGVHLRNAAHIEVRDLEITGDGGAMVDGSPEGYRYGVYLDRTGSGSIQHITIGSLYLHHIYPSVGTSNEGATATTHLGTGVGVNGGDLAVSGHITVRGCRIENVGFKAIELKQVSFVDILDNAMQDIGGPAIQPSRVNDLVVRGNVVDGSGSFIDPRMHGRGSGIWPWGSERVLIERNTFMHARGRADSCGIHIDFNCRDVVVQYNLSIDNAGGFIEILGNNFNCAYRYNISINDGARVKGEPSNGPGTLANNGDGCVIWISGYVGGSTPSGPTNSYLYNNTVYVKGGITSTFSIQESTDGLLIANNIFHIEGPTRDVTPEALDDYTQAMADKVVWANNLYQRAGILPVFNLDLFTDTAPVIGDPLFASTGGLAPEDYIPAATALIVDKGFPVQPIPGDLVGLAIGLPVAVDFFGNPIIGPPDMGAIELGGTPSPLPPAAFAEAPAFVETAAVRMAAVAGPYNTGYHFTEVTGNLGGDNSGWQESPVYIDDGLLPNTTYAYTVTLRNALGEAGAPSAALAVTTPSKDPFGNPLILDEDFSANPNPANAAAPFPVEAWYVAYELEAQESSVVTNSSGQLRTGWGYDAVTVLWQSAQPWSLARDYRFAGDWAIENVLDLHQGLVVGIGAFDAATGERLVVVREQLVGDLVAPVIGQAGSFSIDVSAAELAAAGVTSSMRPGVWFTHPGAATPARNDVYVVDNLSLLLPGVDTDTDRDGIPDSAEPALGLDPANPADGAADLDGDGRSNFAEFLTGTGLSDPSDWFAVSITASPGLTEIALPGRSVLPGRLYILEQSATLQSWSAVDAVSGSAHGPGTGLAFRLEAPFARPFFRVRVEWE